MIKKHVLFLLFKSILLHNFNSLNMRLFYIIIGFFEKLLKQFDSNPLLGIASGSIGYRVDDKIILEKGRDNLPVGGLRVWRKTCFEDTGGFPISYSADAVSNVLANLHGWDTKKYPNVIGIQSRMTSSAQGLWSGYVTRGKSDYYRDYHPIYVMFKFAKYLLTYPFYIGIAYLFGYIYIDWALRDNLMIVGQTGNA